MSDERCSLEAQRDETLVVRQLRLQLAALGELYAQELNRKVELEADPRRPDAQAGERAEIVAWLRWEAGHRPSLTNQRLRDAADAIEAGAHLAPRGAAAKSSDGGT